MPPPLIQLSDIALTFGGTPLLDDVELSVSAGERACLVGRNGSGKSTLLKIAAGMVEPDGGTRFVQPGTTIRYLPQEPDFSGHTTTLAYVEAGLGPTDDPHRARFMLEQLGLTGEEHPAQVSRWRGAPRGARPCAGACARHPAARRADQPSRPADHRMAGAHARCRALGVGADQPRPALSRQPVARDHLARPRAHPPRRARLRRVRSLARRAARRGGARPAQACAQDRSRGALAALRRHRTPQAQRAPARRAAEPAARNAASTAAPPAAPPSLLPKPRHPARW